VDENDGDGRGRFFRRTDALIFERDDQVVPSLHPCLNGRERTFLSSLVAPVEEQVLPVVISEPEKFSSKAGERWWFMVKTDVAEPDAPAWRDGL
jgi:hypothetical protein